MPSEGLEHTPIQANWYYVGHYGQLGPLTLEQMSELARDGVIDRETYVWKDGMSDWVRAATVSDLSRHFLPIDAVPPAFGAPRAAGMPPPHPSQPVGSVAQTPASFQPNPMPFSSVTTVTHGFYMAPMSVPKSDKNRIAAGVLSLIIPGGGRFYLGYGAHGVLQFLLSFCGIGLIWSWIDALYIMCGGVKYDGYGRTLD